MWWKGLAAGILVVLVAAPAYADCERQQTDTAPVRMQLVLDSSGSMAEPDSSGATKIDAAKQALNTVVDKLPASAHVGMRVYGASDLAESDPQACRDSQQVVPVRPTDKPALRQAIGQYQPVGWTPIAYALEQAAKDLGDTGRRSIVLVSDGEETCDRDPAEVARRLRQQGIDLTIDVVGLDVSGSTRQRLERIAAAGGGIYYNATNADELAEALDQSALRPFRPFTVQGTPVEGTLEPTGAPALEPGQYTDTLGPADDVTGRRFYLLNVTPGATVHAAVTLRPDTGPGTPTVRGEVLDLYLHQPGNRVGQDADWCAWTHYGTAELASERPVLSTSVYLGPDGSSYSSDVDPRCVRSDQIVLEVARDDTDASKPRQSSNPPQTPMELVVFEEPPVRTLDGLPRPAEGGNRAQPVPSGQPRGKVVGGASFNDAPALTSGTWTDTIQPGEQLVYRVHAEWGQAPAVSFRIPNNPKLDVSLGGGGVDMAVHSPDRYELATTLLNGTIHATGWASDESEILHTGLPPVRYRNREDSSDAIGPVSSAGDYYFSIAMSEADGCWQTPIEINVAADGAVEGEPEYVELEPDSTSDAESEGDSDAADEQSTTASDDESTESDDNIALKAAVGSIAGGTVLLGAALAVLLLRRPGRGRR